MQDDDQVAETAPSDRDRGFLGVEARPQRRHHEDAELGLFMGCSVSYAAKMLGARGYSLFQMELLDSTFIKREFLPLFGRFPTEPAPAFFYGAVQQYNAHFLFTSILAAHGSELVALFGCQSY